MVLCIAHAETQKAEPSERTVGKAAPAVNLVVIGED